MQRNTRFWFGLLLEKSVTGWTVANALSIGKGGFSATPGSKTPEPIDTKLGVHNYLQDPTLSSKNGSDRPAWGVSAHAWNVTVCDLTFFWFLHLAYRSPPWTDFHDLYVKRRVFAQGSAFWGSRWWIFTIAPFSPPKCENLHYGLWQLQTAITLASVKIEARCSHQSGGFLGLAI